MHTAHIAAFYWQQWVLSGGRYDVTLFSPVGGQLEWFSKYWRECELCFGRAV